MHLFLSSRIPARAMDVASVGRVKGKRSTLYNYLNPHLSVMISAPSRASASLSTLCPCGLYVVDTVMGTVLYHVSLPVVDGKCDIKAVLDENWFVYSYYDDSTEAGSHRVVSVEMYEGYGPDEEISRYVCIRHVQEGSIAVLMNNKRGSVDNSDITSYANRTAEFSAYEQAFLIPHAIAALATTTTKFGVSTQDIISE